MQKKITVIGGGVRGICFAHYAAIHGYQVQLYDKTMLGGCLDSISLDTNYFFELGGHSLTNKYNTIIDILQYYNKEDQIKPIPNLKFDGYSKGEFQSIFKRISWSLLLTSLPKLFFVKKEGKSIQEYYSTVLGKNNYDRLFRYLFRAVLCQRPDDFPAELLFRKRKSNKQFPKKFVLKKGVQQLAEIVKENPNIQCIENTSVAKITKDDSGNYQLWSQAELLTTTSNVCLACPSDKAAKLLNNIHTELSQKLSVLRNSSIDTHLVGFKDQSNLVNRKKSILSFDEGLYSALFHEVSDEKYWVFHFEGNRFSKEERLQTIANAFQISTNTLKLLNERTSILPAITIQDMSLLEEIETEIQEKRLFIASNYIEGLAIEDCGLRAKNEVDRLLKIDAN